MENSIKLLIVGSSSILSLLFGGWSVLLQVLVIFIVIDYVTGLIAAGFNGKLNSRIGFRGIAKKIIILALVAVAHGIDVVLGGTSFFRDTVIFFYIINELISIIENAGNVGLPIPTVLKEAIEALKKKGNKE
ncbi:phage holin family protein [Bacillus sp. Marseille-P3661]|uniref:phage holin family protein n=1 Tax=Bacillus sp. Marseille-P3661 TaxID=1936234 RepID=UPI000C830860|nr:phage holin family protein [Bacillus sp. Marseille-P3661]